MATSTTPATATAETVIIQPKDKSKKALYKWIVVITLLLLVLFWSKSKPQPKQQPLPANYRAAVCENAWQGDTQEPAGNHFTIKLHEGCFGGFVHFPKEWHGEWHYQPVGNDPGWWFSIWFEGGREPEGLFDRNATPNFAYHPTVFRLQGKEGQEILFYTSDATPAGPTQPPAQSSFVPTGYEKRFCNAAAENDDGDLHNADIPDFQIAPLHTGCFSGPFILPKTWKDYNIDKSQEKDDWATMWCEGRTAPEPAHSFNEDFGPNEFKNCKAFYLQGKGSVLLKRLSRR